MSAFSEHPAPDIILCAFNARWRHTAFGLRCLKANMGEMEKITEILEFDLETQAAQAVESVWQHSGERWPRIIGVSVAIWNVLQSTGFVQTLKRVAPETIVVLGGPEVSHETMEQPVANAADYVVCGAGEVVFATLCREILANSYPSHRIITAPPPDPATLSLPYDLYTERDIQHRELYVESTRGCPWRCSFCLSALDKTVTYFDQDHFFAAMQALLDRGA
ncbi:MAG: cobalamin-dependent protein, partial [Magnetococcales bacterium]|nr:cobalamin-dependent protein [Magnetococcales bacterium]